MRLRATFLSILESKALALGAGVLLLSFYANANPSWFKNTKTILTEHEALINCTGSGPSFDLARREAIFNCNTAINQFLRKNAKVYSVSIQTTTATEYHEELSSDEVYKNLSCIPVEESSSKSDDAHTVWLRCRFDLKKLDVEEVKHEPKENRHDLRTLRPFMIGDTPSITDETIGVYSISVVPQCDEVLIRGFRPRVLKCSSNPFQLTVYKGDTEILVNKTGFLTKKIEVTKDKVKDESITVILEKILRSGL